MSTKLNWDSFKSKFGTWADYIKPAFDLGLLDPVFAELKALTARGKTVAPISKDVFKCFQMTPYKNCYAVLMAPSAFDSRNNGEIVADGLALSCSTTIMNKELELFYDGVERDTGMNLDLLKVNGLEYLAERGVLLLNAGLTTEIGKFGSHSKLWEPFIAYLCEEVFSIMGIPVIMMGKKTHRFEKHLAPMQWNFKIDYPENDLLEWHTDGAFSKVSKIIKDTNGYDLQWLMSYNLPF